MIDGEFIYFYGKIIKSLILSKLHLILYYGDETERDISTQLHCKQYSLLYY